MKDALAALGITTGIFAGIALILWVLVWSPLWVFWSTLGVFVFAMVYLIVYALYMEHKNGDIR